MKSKNKRKHPVYEGKSDISIKLVIVRETLI